MLTLRNLPEWELWACALAVVRQYGEAAALYAAGRADALLAEGDALGSRNWSLILQRIDQLSAAPVGDLH